MHLHCHKIIHRDIACRNILVSKDWSIKLSDFGLSIRALDNRANIRRGERVAWAWLPPEVFRENAFTMKSDIWSAGVTIWEILSKGKQPYEDIQKARSLTPRNVMKLIGDSKLRLECPKSSDPKCLSLFNACMIADPIERPNALEVLKVHIPEGLTALEQFGTSEMKLELTRNEWARMQVVYRKFEDGFDFYHGLNWKRQSKTTAVALIGEAASLGSVAAEAFCFQEGLCGRAIDKKKGTWIVEKAIKKDERIAYCLLGDTYFNWRHGLTEDNKKAFVFYRQAAKLELTRGQRALGEWYLFVKKDNELGFQWHMKAAEGGDSLAQYTVGKAYASGVGVSKDPKKSVEWHQKAADGGYKKSQYILGLYHLHGQQGLAKSREMAFKWFREAARQGHVEAKRHLGLGL